MSASVTDRSPDSTFILQFSIRSKTLQYGVDKERKKQSYIYTFIVKVSPQTKSQAPINNKKSALQIICAITDIH